MLKNKLFLNLFTLVVVLALPSVASSAPIVTYSVSGASGNYTLSFSVTNNLNPGMDIYFFGVDLSQHNVTGSPTGFDPNIWSTWNNLNYGGSSITYDNNWIDFSFSNLNPGDALSGFNVTVSDLVAPTSVNWFAFAISSTGVTYTGSDFFYGPGNPGFEGVAGLVTETVPEPATLALVGLGLAGLGFGRRKKG